MNRIRKSIISIIAVLMLITAAMLTLSACGGADTLECTHEWKDATCILPKTCKLCGITEGGANGHTVELSVTDSTCEGEGEIKALCSVCGAVETEKTPKKGHTYTHVVTEPTCTESGYTTHTCHCGDTYKDSETAALKHDLKTYAKKPATCSETGYEAYEECSRCDYTTYKELDMTEHRFTTRKATVTCSTAGFEMKVCEDCSYTELISYTPALNHDINSHAAKAPTCTEIGWNAYDTCKRCDYTTYKELDMTEHDTEEFAAKDPSCSEAGRNAYVACKDCDYTTYVEIPRTEHSYTEFVQEANCRFDGIVMNICDDCGATELISHTPAGGHNYKTTVTPPTCTEDGYTTYKCDGCNDVYTSDVIEATGHGFGTWFISKVIDETCDGEERRNCMNCNEFETRDIAVLETGNLGRDTSGNKTDEIVYKIYADGTMKLTGTGDTYGCGWNGASQPYIGKRADIKRLIIGEGITETVSGVFAYFTNLEYVYIPKTLTKLGTNTFMCSFKKGITSFTIPATVTDIGTYLLGDWRNGGGTTFTDIIVENPNLRFFSGSNDHCIFNGEGVPKTNLKLYSYGAYNNVSAYAEKVGATYIDLNSLKNGTDGDIDYTYSVGILTLKPNTNAPTLPSTMKWADEIDISEVEKIVLGDGITAIPADYFKNYTALTSVDIPDSVTSIGSGSFSTDTACSVVLSMTFPQATSYIGSGVFSGRTNVTVNGFEDSATDNFAEDGVTVSVKKSFRLLLIGNSLSQDAADCSKTTTSQLYYIIKAMLGENSFVQIGVLYSGARTASWHATVAESGNASYAFNVISDDTDGKWSMIGSKTSEFGLTYADWDVVTIQPYAGEATSGVGSMTETDGKDGSKDEKFLALSVSLPYLLDHIDKHAPNADVYYYMTWATTTSTHDLDLGNDNLTKRINVAKTAMSYTGTESGKAFTGIINAGTAIQNARRTYLAYLSYDNTDDTIAGLQRDGVHISYFIGRYILGLTFAEILIPEAKRADGYVLPDASASTVAAIGELPPEYSEIARLAVAEAIRSIDASGSAQYKPAIITGYKIDPCNVLLSEIALMDFTGLKASDAASLENAIKQRILENAKPGTKITVTLTTTPTLNSTPNAFSATISISFGYTSGTVDIEGAATVP